MGDLMIIKNFYELGYVVFLVLGMLIVDLVVFKSMLLLEVEGVEFVYIVEFLFSIVLLEGKDMMFELEGKLWGSVLKLGMIDLNFLFKWFFF